MTVQPATFRFDPQKTGLELARDWLAQRLVGGFLDRLRVIPDTCEDGLFTATCTLDPGHANFVGLVHGGVLSALVDISGGGAVMTCLQRGETLLTTDLNIRFLAAVPIDTPTLQATGHVTHRSGRRMVASVLVTTPKGEAVAEGSVGVSVRRPG
ncbi:PaaI family thioesterase [Pseudooceanicola aestuarii]|uniref:PaaI family thioesterase n=1 Tax=Pseudooceanicola aestuarii TaxID=2697319 RepID=UPI0013D514CA|nr:PaaI family thioesterase [Pseudooceanicola aestuarii]